MMYNMNILCSVHVHVYTSPHLASVAAEVLIWQPGKLHCTYTCISELPYLISQHVYTCRVSYRIFFLGGGRDCMGVVGVGRVKHVLPRGVWGHVPQEILKMRCSEMDSGGFLAASRL